MDVGVLLQLMAGVVLTGLAGAVGWLVRTIGTNQRRVDVLEAAVEQLASENFAARLRELGERTAKVEAKVDVLDSIRKDIAAVHTRVDDVLGTTRELKGALNALSNTNASILEALIPGRRGE